MLIYNMPFDREMPWHTMRQSPESFIVSKVYSKIIIKEHNWIIWIISTHSVLSCYGLVRFKLVYSTSYLCLVDLLID